MKNHPDPERILLNYDYEAMDEASIRHSIANRMVYTVGKDGFTATERDWFEAVAFMTRDRLTERWMETMRGYYRSDVKRVYYLSMEFLIGRSLLNGMLNLGFRDQAVNVLEDMGMALEEVAEQEADAALGNGGLGRLAACFLDSLATLRMPGYGYGIRYEYGMFRQEISKGAQVEHPDSWLRYPNPWEFDRPEVLYQIDYYGRVVEYKDEKGVLRHHWVDTEEVMAMAYDTPVPGYGVDTVNDLRLWTAKASRDFDLGYFNEGNYTRAVEEKTQSENLSKVLYPNDVTEMGKELRLKQQYFFVSASLQDILHRFNRTNGEFELLPDKVAIQLNDTHPSLAIPELMRLLVDIYHLDWDRAWDITTRTFSYTNHTLLPEALEVWPISLFERMLPRHLQIIYEINHQFLNDVMHRYPGDCDRLQRMSLVDERGERQIRMAHLAIVGSHKVNGVAALHTELLKSQLFQDFNEFYPGKFVNITNGITPRLWLNQANPALTALIDQQLGDEPWLTHLERLHELVPLADDTNFRARFREVKRANKQRLTDKIAERLGIQVNPDSLFDVQIKRLHEYKRQLLNVLHIVLLYNRIRDGIDPPKVPRTFIFAGKAAPGYWMAKQIIHLINDVGDIVNNDPCVEGRLKIVFIPNYDVTTATDIIPAADLSEQISTAGTEASGTGNMKLSLNGALTIGTLDGANVEIKQEVGEENIFIFGHTVEELADLRRSGYRPRDYYENNPDLKRIIDMIGNGFFSPTEPTRYSAIVEALLNQDQYMLLADFEGYAQAQQRVEELFLDPDEWSRKAILNVAQLGRFSSDRTIREYAETIWDIEPLHHEHPPRPSPD